MTRVEKCDGCGHPAWGTLPFGWVRMDVQRRNEQSGAAESATLAFCAGCVRLKLRELLAHAFPATVKT